MKILVSPGVSVVVPTGGPGKRKFNPPPWSDNYNEIGIFSTSPGIVWFYAKYTLASGDEYMYLYGNGDLVHASIISTQCGFSPPDASPPFWKGTYYNFFVKSQIHDKILLI